MPNNREDGSVLQQPVPHAVCKGAIHHGESDRSAGAQHGGKGKDGERARD